MKKKLYTILLGTCLVGSMIIPSYAHGSFIPPGIAKKGAQFQHHVHKNVGFMKNQLESKQWITLKGWVEDVDSDTLEIKMDSITTTFSIKKDTVVMINGRKGSLDALHKGDWIAAKFVNNAFWITNFDDNNLQPYKNKENFVVGEIDDVYYKDYKIKVEYQDDERIIELNKDTAIYINGKKKDIDDLDDDMMIKAYLKNNIAYKVMATDYNAVYTNTKNYVTGEIDDVYYKDYKIKVEYQDYEKMVTLNKDTDIYIDGKKKDIKDLDDDMMVKIYLKNNVAYKVIATEED